MNITTSRTYNNQSYNVLMKVYETDITLTSPHQIESSAEEALIVPTESILYIMFENSMTEVIPKAEFEILDEGFIITSKLKPENTRIHITIVKDAGALGGENTVIDLIWIVKKFDILSLTATSIHYRIWCESDISIPLYTICRYATPNDLNNDVDGRENPFDIIKSLLTQSGISMYPDSSKDEDGRLVRNRYSPPYCDEFVQFITYQNMYTFDAVNYLLSIAPGTFAPSPPAYLIYNLKDRKAFVTSRENLFDPVNIEMQPLSTRYYYSITSSSLGRQYQMYDIKLAPTKLELGGIENAKLFYNHNFYKYDHKERIWENDKISKFSLNNLLTSDATSPESSLYLKNGNEDLELSHYYQYAPINAGKIYHIMRALELFSSNIQFTVDGNLDLDVGQVINISENSDIHKQEMFHGKWMIIKIRHSFRNKEYKTNLICSRTYYTKVM